MNPELVQEWLLNPLLWVAVAAMVLLLELFVVSGVSLAIGLAGILVGGGMFLFVPETDEAHVTAAAGRMILIVGSVWSLFSLGMIVVLRFWIGRRQAPADPNEYARGVGVEIGECKTADVVVPAYEDVLKDYKPRLE